MFVTCNSVACGQRHILQGCALQATHLVSGLGVNGVTCSMFCMRMMCLAGAVVGSLWTKSEALHQGSSGSILV